MTWEDAVSIATELPGVETYTSYGTPALKVRGKLLTRLRPEDDSITLHEVPIDEREMLIEADPALFHTTPHYADYPIVLARLEPLPPTVLRRFLERRWRVIASKTMVKAFDAGTGRCTTSSGRR